MKKQKMSKKYRGVNMLDNSKDKDMIIIDSSKSIKEKEVWFEDGILVENGVINALLTMDAGQVEKNFGLKELNYDEDYYYVY